MDLTKRASQALVLAEKEADRCNREKVGTKDILLGLAKEGTGLAATLLKKHSIGLRELRVKTEELFPPLGEPRTSVMHQTDRVKKILVDATTEAQNMDHQYIGTEHILLALTKADPDSSAIKVLKDLGINPEELRIEIFDLLDVVSLEEFNALPVNIRNDCIVLAKFKGWTPRGTWEKITKACNQLEVEKKGIILSIVLTLALSKEK